MYEFNGRLESTRLINLKTDKLKTKTNREQVMGEETN